MSYKIDAYHDSAHQYADAVAAREAAGVEHDPIMPHFLELLGDVSGLTALDAGCGSGYLSRILEERGARVTGIDIAEGLIQLAREQDTAGTITYQRADLCQPMPAYHNHFDLVASHFVLNDIYDYKGFLATLGSVVKPGGRLIFSMNSPYAFVVKNHITDYFDTGKAFPYPGMVEHGIKVHFYHHTLEEYIDACSSARLQLQRLIDVPSPEGTFKRRPNTLIPEGHHFPLFMILSLVKP